MPACLGTCRFVRRSYYLRDLRSRRLRSGWQSGVDGILNTASVEFWFEFGSTYSYLSSARIEDMAAAAGVPILWEPFLLGPIFAEQGWDDSPFNVYPAKGRYMWRDMERLCTEYCIPFTRPSHFPRNGLLAARIACLAKATSELWLPEFTRVVFQANFAEDREIGDPAEIRSILDSLGQSGAQLIEQAQAPENKLRLREQTRRAKELGIFGAPSFVVGAELFWGNDRLEDALAWAGSRTGEARR
jgi:2-hydroxychromene-2-carboxylate isomerase